MSIGVISYMLLLPVENGSMVSKPGNFPSLKQHSKVSSINEDDNSEIKSSQIMLGIN